MIEIKAKEKDDDGFELDFKAKATDRSKYIDQVTAVLNALYHADEKLFVLAIADSDFGKMVMTL